MVGICTLIAFIAYFEGVWSEKAESERVWNKMSKANFKLTRWMVWREGENPSK